MGIKKKKLDTQGNQCGNDYLETKGKGEYNFKEMGFDSSFQEILNKKQQHFFHTPRFIWNGINFPQEC